MDTQHWLARYQLLLGAAADPIRATGMSAYMKNQFPFLGIPTPKRRKLIAALEIEIKKNASSAEVIALAQQLYSQNAREYHYCALELIIRCLRQLDASHWPAIEALITTHSWWDSVDTLASKIVGPLIQREPSLLAIIDAHVSHANFWLRRTAILYQLGYKTDTDQQRLFHACLANTGESEFFIRKAIGWALRQYARVAPDAVKYFVQTHQTALSPLSKREALKHLTA